MKAQKKELNLNFFEGLRHKISNNFSKILKDPKLLYNISFLFLKSFSGILLKLSAFKDLKLLTTINFFS